jgi:pimeloyl-ACP methyl ester carboxylesterase
MEPQIQYTTTTDGVQIAYATAGSGPPVLRASTPGSHIRLDWDGLEVMRVVAQSVHAVWYDARGGGLSERSATDFTMDAMLRDLEAVVQAVAFERFTLVAAGDAVPIAVTYAARNQSRIGHLVLINGWLKAADWQQGFPYEIQEAVRTKSEQAYLEALARTIYPESPEAARQFVAESPIRIDTDLYIASQKAMEDWNAESLPGEITAPALVIHNPASVWLPVSVAQGIAAGIADSRLVFEDTATPRLATLIEEFILGSPAARPQAAPPSGTAIVLFCRHRGLDGADGAPGRWRVPRQGARARRGAARRDHLERRYCDRGQAFG